MTRSKVIQISTGENFRWNLFEWVNQETGEKTIGWAISETQIGFGFKRKMVPIICKKYDLQTVVIGTETFYVTFDLEDEWDLNDFTERIQADIHKK